MGLEAKTPKIVFAARLRLKLLVKKKKNIDEQFLSVSFETLGFSPRNVGFVRVRDV